MEKLKEQHRRFLAWQKRPYQVAALSDEEHECPTCGTRYHGNYCPRCGQSSKIGRYSLKKAFMHFLDVWGLGNRGMFRTLRDLLLRPGYMIFDYLSGMQMAYFPPFKLLFLLVALSLLIDSGFNIKGEDRVKMYMERIDKGLEQAQIANLEDDSAGQQSAESVEESQRDKEALHYLLLSLNFVKKVFQWFLDHRSIVTLAVLLLISGLLYLSFRRCPRIPDMGFSEFFVAMIYTYSMMMVYSVVISFFCLPSSLKLLPYAASIVSLKQLSGYGYPRTILNIAATVAVFVILVFLLTFVTVVAVAVVYSYNS